VDWTGSGSCRITGSAIRGDEPSGSPVTVFINEGNISTPLINKKLVNNLCEKVSQNTLQE
jgi:hypothetical protein